MSGRFVFFGGKGGVGKTTCAAAWALWLAESGQRVLLVSTDPAHSLGDALAMRLTATPKQQTTRRGALFALELDADAALTRWMKKSGPALRTIATRGTYLDDDDVDELMRLSLPGVDELMGLMELDRLASKGRWDTVVVDTAPTGHTLRLLQTPSMLRGVAEVLDDMQEKHRVIAASLARGYRGDAEDAFIEALDRRGEELARALRDPKMTSLHWVALAEGVVVSETEHALATLDDAGIHAAELLVNRLTPPPPQACPLCEGRRKEEASALERLAELGHGRVLRTIPLATPEPRGLAALRAFRRSMKSTPRFASGTAPGRQRQPRTRAPVSHERAVTWPAELRLIFFGGKGGVGKTTSACAAALEMAWADAQRRVLLLSTDPAPSVGDALAMAAGDELRQVPAGPANLWVRELDARRDFERRKRAYQDSVSELFDALRGRSRLDATYDRRIMEDLIELAPPGMDELFALMTVMDALIPAWTGQQAAPFDTVVVDTAPTGHALRLLELPQKAQEWVHTLMSVLLKYREVVAPGRLAEDLLQASRSLKALRALLADPARSRFVVVTRAEALPRAETRRLLLALRRLRVPVGELIVNALTPGPDLLEEVRVCRRCRATARSERAAVKGLLYDTAALRGRKAAVIFAPAIAPPPRGPKTLRSWSHTWKRR